MGVRQKIKRALRIFCNIGENLLSRPIMILTYHRVAELSDDPNLLAVSPANFAAQMEFLSCNYPILRFDGDWTEQKKAAFVITFDDGYADNLLNALPILEKYQVPATFFITSRAIGATAELPWDGGQIPQRPEFRTLTLDELQKLAAHPLVTIGSHTLTHRNLATLDFAEQKQEILAGHHQLEAWLGRPVEVMSYPFGNYQDLPDRRVWQELDLPQIKRVAANFPGQVHPHSDRYFLPRHVVRNYTLEQFKQKLFRYYWL